MRIDTHVHLWQRSQYHEVYEAYGRPAELRPLLRDFTAADLRQCMDEVGIDHAVLIQMAQTDSHNDDLLSIAAREACIGAVIGWVDLASDTLAQRLETLAMNPLFRGIRDPLEGKPIDWLAQPQIRRGLRELARYGFIFELLIGKEHWSQVVSLAREIPELPLVINHFGKPTKATLEDWDQQLLQPIASLPQIYVKLSGIMALFPPSHWLDWSVPEIQSFLDRLLNRLGPMRLLTGTDWPVATLAGSYQRHTEALEGILSSLSVVVRNLIQGENAHRLYAIR